MLAVLQSRQSEAKCGRTGISWGGGGRGGGWPKTVILR